MDGIFKIQIMKQKQIGSYILYAVIVYGAWYLWKRSKKEEAIVPPEISDEVNDIVSQIKTLKKERKIVEEKCFPDFPEMDPNTCPEFWELIENEKALIGELRKLGYDYDLEYDAVLKKYDPSQWREFSSFTNYGLGGLVQTAKTPPPTGHILADIELSQKYGSLGFCGC